MLKLSNEYRNKRLKTLGKYIATTARILNEENGPFQHHHEPIVPFYAEVAVFCRKPDQVCVLDELSLDSTVEFQDEGKIVDE